MLALCSTCGSSSTNRIGKSETSFIGSVPSLAGRQRERVFARAAAGKDDPRARALARLRSKSESAAVQTDERRSDGQTESRPAAFLLGGEKRIAQARKMLLGNADTFVAHLEDHTALAVIERSRHGDAAVPLGQGLHGIGQKIDDDLLHVLRIAGQRAATLRQDRRTNDRCGF